MEYRGSWEGSCSDTASETLNAREASRIKTRAVKIATELLTVQRQPFESHMDFAMTILNVRVFQNS